MPLVAFPGTGPTTPIHPATNGVLNVANPIDGPDGPVTPFAAPAVVGPGVTVHALGDACPVDHPYAFHTVHNLEATTARGLTTGVGSGPPRPNVYFV